MKSFRICLNYQAELDFFSYFTASNQILVQTMNPSIPKCQSSHFEKPVPKDSVDC